jgi:hypothetical protein
MASGVPGAGTVGGMIGSQVADSLGVPSQTFSLAAGGAVGYADGGEIMPQRDLGADPTVQRAMDVTRGYQDPPTKHIEDWQWKSLPEVQQRLGGLREIPSHVQAFGNYMDEIAKRASNEGLSARDLIKAYTITRASIQRRANDVDRVRAAGLDLPKSFTGKIRPEGAFGEWLHTRPGQDYLDSAERGEVNEDAIANAVKVMTPFGKHEKDIPDALRWAAANLPGKEQFISTLVANAMRGASEPAEWRSMAKDVRGIGPSKAGFLASLMGRGDQPTLDARQIIEHTGRPTSEAQAFLRRKGGEGATEAVERLSARQRAMNLELPEELKPYYQHLAHHAVWDKAANEVTTHEDVMNAMRGAASGGEIDAGSILSHPVVHAMRMAGLPKLEITRRADGGSIGDDPTVQRALDLTRDHLRYGGSPEDDLYRQYMSKILRPQSEELYEAAKKVAEGYKIGDLSYSGFKQHPVMPSDVKTTISDLPNISGKKADPLSWGKFYQIAKGGTLFTLGGDRSNLGRLTHINGKELAWPVDLHAGTKYQTEPNPGVVWANDANAATALRNNILKAAEKGPVYGAFAPMNPTAVDSSRNMMDVLLSQLANTKISKSAAKKFDDLLMQGVHIYREAPGTPEKKRQKQEKAVDKMKEWPGIASAEKARDFALNKMTGAERAALVKLMDAKMWLNEGFPSVSVTRAAITDPELLHVSSNMIGGNVVELDPREVDRGNLAFEHSTYNTPTAGRLVGKLPFVERQAALPDFTQERMMDPQYVSAKTGESLLIHPYSPNPGGRSAFRGDTELRQGIQPINERMIDSIYEDAAQKKVYGFKKGGSIVDAALRMTAPDRPMVALADLFQRQLRGRPPS